MYTSGSDRREGERAKADFLRAFRALRDRQTDIADMLDRSASVSSLQNEMTGIVSTDLIGILRRNEDLMYRNLPASEWVELAVRRESCENRFAEQDREIQSRLGNTNRVPNAEGEARTQHALLQVRSESPLESRYLEHRVTGHHSPEEWTTPPRARSLERGLSPIQSAGSRGSEATSASFAEALREVTQALAVSRLPIAEPAIFSGDPTQFIDWENQFDLAVGTKPISDVEKLHILRKYLAGRAKDAVAGFFLIPDAAAYASARKVLKVRFGHPSVVTNAFRDRLDQCTSVRDAAGLQHYSDLLVQCAAAHKALGGLSVLDDPRVNATMAAKLPDWVAHRWRRVAAGRSVDSPFPSFEAFVEFVEEEARIANDPLQMSAEPERFHLARAHNTAVYEHSTESGRLLSKDKSCTFCDGAHGTADCYSLGKLPPSERRQFLFKQMLCYTCIKPGHLARDCRSAPTCKRCKGGHATCTHPGTARAPKGSVPAPAGETTVLTVGAPEAVGLHSKASSQQAAHQAQTDSLETRETESTTVLKVGVSEVVNLKSEVLSQQVTDKVQVDSLKSQIASLKGQLSSLQDYNEKLGEFLRAENIRLPPELDLGSARQALGGLDEIPAVQHRQGNPAGVGMGSSAAKGRGGEESEGRQREPSKSLSTSADKVRGAEHGSFSVYQSGTKSSVAEHSLSAAPLDEEVARPAATRQISSGKYHRQRLMNGNNDIHFTTCADNYNGARLYTVGGEGTSSPSRSPPRRSFDWAMSTAEPARSSGPLSGDGQVRLPRLYGNGPPGGGSECMSV